MSAINVIQTKFGGGSIQGQNYCKCGILHLFHCCSKEFILEDCCCHRGLGVESVAEIVHDCCNQESCAHSASVATQSELGMAAFHHRNLENTLECNGNQQKFQKWFDGKEPSVVFATQPSPSLESLRSLNRILKKHWNATANSSLGPIPVGDWESAHFFFGIAN